MIKAWLNNLNGWQRIFLLLSVVWASIVCFTEIVLEEEIEEFRWIEKPSERLMSDAALIYTECVRKQTYEQYLTTYKEEYEAHILSGKQDVNKRKESFSERLKYSSTNYPQSYLPEYKAMEEFLDTNGIPVSKGLSLRIEKEYGSMMVSRFVRNGHRCYRFMREHFPEFSEEFDVIDRALKEKSRYKVAYVKELAQNYLLSPLKIFAVVILPIIGVYFLLLAMISLTRWVLAGFSS